MRNDLAFVFAAGAGEVGRQSRHLLRSIREYHPEAPAYAFVPEDERDTMDETVLKELRDGAELLVGEIPIPEYPISTKIAATAAAEEATDADYLLMLDTDMVLLDRIDAHERSDADLFLKPVDVGRQFWGRDRSLDWWRRLYDRFDLPFPTRRVTSTFDRREILPYWNAGFVLARTGTVGREWLEMTAAIHDEIPYNRHADQVALGILSTRYETDALDERYNYPLQIHLGCPSDVKVLHYHDRHELAKVRNGTIQRKVRRVGLRHDVPIPSVAYLRLMLYSVSIYVRRKTLPIDETHALERAYLRVRSLLGV